MPRAVFRVDASSRIGLGHLSRCLTLARALVNHEGFAVEFVSREPDGHVQAWVAREGHVLRAVEATEDEARASARAAATAALVIVDGYGFGRALHDALRGPGRVVCVLDDLGDAPIGGDVVHNGNLYAEELTYDGPPARLLGPGYALLRDEFRAARGARLRRARGARPRVLVTMGGADPTGETEKALDALADLDHLDATVVVGAANPRAAALRQRAVRLAPRVELRVDVREMGALMAASDVALTAAGSTCLELACVGVPAGVVTVADNQLRVAHALSTRGLATALGRSEDVTPAKMKTALLAMLASPSAATEDRLRASVDGLGARRSARALKVLCQAQGADGASGRAPT